MAKEATSGGMEGVGVGDFAAPGLELIGAFTDKDATFGAKGSAIGGGIGAGLGAIVGGPAGAAIGKALGNTVGQLIGGAKDKKLATERMSSTMNRKYGQLNLAYNANPYGSGSTFYAEDGLVLPGVGDKVQVNIEKDELLVDPSKMEVLQKFDSKRYKRHAKDKSQEHPGNFIEMDASHVIIPRKKAKLFAEGDRITRRSIIAQIMEDQENNGVEVNDESIYAEDGVVPSAYRNIKPTKYEKPKSAYRNIEVSKYEKPKPEPSAYRKIQPTKYEKPETIAKRKANSKPPKFMDTFDKNFGFASITPNMSDPDEVKKQQEFLNTKINSRKGGIPLKVDGDNGPLTQAAIKKYGYMPYQGKAVTPSIIAGNKGNGWNPSQNNSIVSFDENGQMVGNTVLPGLTDNEVYLAEADQNQKAANAAFNSAFANTSGPSAETGDMSGVTDISNRNPAPDKKGFNLNLNKMKAARAMNFLPTAVGLMQAGQNDPFLQYDDNGQIDAAKAMIQQMPTEENTEASRAAVAQGQAGYLKAMRNVNSPAARAEVADFMLKSQGQAGLIEQDKENRRVQRVTQKLGMLADMEQKQGADRLNARNKFALESSQDRAARQGLIHSAISEGAVNFGKSVMDEERIDIANSMLRFNKVNVGGGANVINEDSDAVNTAIANVASILPGPMATSYQVPSIPGVSRGIPLVNGSAALPGIGATRTATRPRVGPPATAKRILGS